MALGVVLLDMCELSSTAEGVVVPVTMSNPSGRTLAAIMYNYLCVLLVDCWIAAANIPDIALEVLHVDDIEPDYSLRMLNIGTTR